MHLRISTKASLSDKQHIACLLDHREAPHSSADSPARELTPPEPSTQETALAAIACKHVIAYNLHSKTIVGCCKQPLAFQPNSCKCYNNLQMSLPGGLLLPYSSSYGRLCTRETITNTGLPSACLQTHSWATSLYELASRLMHNIIQHRIPPHGLLL